MEHALTEIAEYLLRQSWQIAAIFVLAAAACWALRKASAHWRYLLWLVVLVKCLTPPLVTLPVPVLPQAQPQNIELAQAPPADPVLPIADTVILPEGLSEAPVSAIDAPSYATPEPADAYRPPVAAAESATPVEAQPRLTATQWGAFGWIAAAGVFGLFALFKAYWIQRRLKRTRRPITGELRDEVTELAHRLGLRGVPKVWLIDGIGQPFVWGLLRGSIYLPGDFAGTAPAEHRRAILMHELAHVSRYDAAVNALQILVQGIFFFHPLTWWANRRIRQEREKCCDEMAIATLAARPRQYSTAIVDTLVNEYKSARPISSLAVAGPVKNIEERIKTIMKPNKRFYKRPTWLAIVTVLLLAALAVPTALTLTARAEAKTEKTDAQPATKTYAWNRMDKYVRPDFEAFFPDDAEGGKKLDELFENNRFGGNQPDLEILKTVRNGLRRTTKHRTLVLAAIGNRYIWGKDPQNSKAVEIMYHAADPADKYGTRHYAVYFGLSVLKRKPPNVLRTLIEICMKGEDVGRISWGCKPQLDELRGYLKPYLQSKDPQVREIATLLDKHFRGEIDFEKWKRDKQTEDARAKYATQFPQFKETLRTGSSQARRVLIRTMLREYGLVRAMDDSFLDAWIECAKDHDPGVRSKVARIIGSRWIWGQAEQNPKAIAMMLELSKDENRDVRYNSVYFGLSVVRTQSGAVLRRLQTMAKSDEDRGLHKRIQWALGRTQPATQPAVTGGHSKRSVEMIAKKAELMGKVEEFFMHNYRDISSRKSLEWGDVATHEDGNRSIRYKYRAIIWGKKTIIANHIFTFGPEGKFVNVKNVEGFPKTEQKTPRQAQTKEQLIELVEEFFRRNYRDITARKTLEWGKFQKQEDGNVSIRYKYLATIRNRKKLVIEQVFTFTPEGKFVSVKDIAKSPATQPAVVE